MSNLPRLSSARSLVNLYTVIVGVSLTFGVSVLIDPKLGLASVSQSSLWLFMAYLVTLFPFYHGALRHLDDAYFENPQASEKSGALIFDFFLLFAHALGFVVLSVLLKAPPDFACTLLIILGIDVLWGVFAYFASGSAMKFNATAKWATINAVAFMIGAGYLATHSVSFGTKQLPAGFSFLVFLFSALRTLVDYLACGSFYFPREAVSPVVTQPSETGGSN